MVAFGQSGQYALRAMVRIAALKAGETITGLELAELTGVPPHYLSKILRKLVEAGLLRSQRGPQGGFYLARPARAIRFADVLDAVGSEFESNRCAFGWGKCNPRAYCPLHPAFEKLNCLIQAWREQTTLADVTEEC
jgi:Rrf2 family protein